MVLAGLVRGSDGLGEFTGFDSHGFFSFFSVVGPSFWQILPCQREPPGALLDPIRSTGPWLVCWCWAFAYALAYSDSGTDDSDGQPEGAWKIPGGKLAPVKAFRFVPFACS